MKNMTDKDFQLLVLKQKLQRINELESKNVQRNRQILSDLSSFEQKIEKESKYIELLKFEKDQLVSYFQRVLPLWNKVQKAKQNLAGIHSSPKPWENLSNLTLSGFPSAYDRKSTLEEPAPIENRNRSLDLETLPAYVNNDTSLHRGQSFSYGEDYRSSIPATSNMVFPKTSQNHYQMYNPDDGRLTRKVVTKLGNLESSSPYTQAKNFGDERNVMAASNQQRSKAFIRTSSPVTKSEPLLRRALMYSDDSDLALPGNSNTSKVIDINDTSITPPISNVQTNAEKTESRKHFQADEFEEFITPEKLWSETAEKLSKDDSALHVTTKNVTFDETPATNVPELDTFSPKIDNHLLSHKDNAKNIITTEAKSAEVTNTITKSTEIINTMTNSNPDTNKPSIERADETIRHETFPEQNKLNYSKELATKDDDDSKLKEVKNFNNSPEIETKEPTKNEIREKSTAAPSVVSEDAQSSDDSFFDQKINTSVPFTNTYQALLSSTQLDQSPNSSEDDDIEKEMAGIMNVPTVKSQPAKVSVKDHQELQRKASKETTPVKQLANPKTDSSLSKKKSLSKLTITRKTPLAALNFSSDSDSDSAPKAKVQAKNEISDKDDFSF